MLAVSSTVPSMNNYGATSADINDFNGCSAACYVGLMLGYTYGVSDGYSFSSISSNPQFVNSLSSAGLTWQAYCAQGCPRGADHFPFSGPNAFTGSSVTTSTFISAANSANPPNFLWYTPTDSQNMHDVSVSTGDSYLQSFLVGSGRIASPATGSLLASSLFTSSSYRTLLMLWWDECGGSNGSCDSNNSAPNLFYGTPVKRGYVSPDTVGIDEYALAWTLESNFGLSPLAQGDRAAQASNYQLNDIFGQAASLPLSASLRYLPTAPLTNTAVSFTATAFGGTAPYSYSWNFGDGSTANGLSTTHSYTSSGTYTVTLTVTDSASGSAQATQTVQIVSAPTLTASFTYSPSQPVAGQSVRFTGSGLGGVPPYNFNWNFGDGATSSSQSPSHTYTSSGSYIITLTIGDSSGISVSTSQSITIAPPIALTASFSFTPTSPVSGQTVTFTAAGSGGTGAYSYNWDLAGTSKSGKSVAQSFTAGTYTISLTIQDSTGQTATSSQSLTVRSASSGSTTIPTLIGWGGIRMDESVAGSGGTPSAVFPGESASNMELLLIELKAKGYNAVRVDFDPYCTDTVDFNYMSVYSQTNAQRAVEIAKYYGFWIILDYHGYSDIFLNTTCWLNYWQPIVQNIGPLYSQIVWEPENEPTLSCTNSPSSCPSSAPCSSDSSCVGSLSGAYQQWINQARSLGDAHWIVVQNLCSYACGFSDMSQGYPTVTDPLGTLSQGGKIFISLHSYMDYNQYSGSWTNSTAETVANQYYLAVVAGVSNTGWPALNTEGGTDTLSCDPNFCGSNIILDGSAGYTAVTFHFIQTLVNLYDGNTPQRVNWLWWPAGSWTNTPGSGVYGAMQCNINPIGWGCLLNFVPLASGTPPPSPPPSPPPTPPPSPAPLSTSFNYSPSTPTAGQRVTFAAFANGGTSPYSFSWSFGDGSTGTGSPVSHTYSSAGSFTIILTSSDTGSPQQTATSQQTIVVSGPASRLTTSFIYTPTVPFKGQPVTFSATASSGTGPYSFNWVFGDGSSGTGSNVTHTYASAGSFTVILTTTDNSVSRLTATSAITITVASSSPGVPTAKPAYTLSWMGFDWDGGHEETLTLNGNLVATFPSNNSPQNAQVYAFFSVDITSLISPGVNTLVMTHANWDCGVTDTVISLQLALHINSQTALVYSNSTAQPLNCGQTLTYQFTSPKPIYKMTWMGYDWDGGHEETLTLNGQNLASLPANNSPQNQRTYVPFSLDVTPLVIAGVNTLTIFSHHWDCGVADNVANLQVSLQIGNLTLTVYTDPATEPLSCKQSLTLNFTAPIATGIALQPIRPSISTDNPSLVTRISEAITALTLFLPALVAVFGLLGTGTVLHIRSAFGRNRSRARV
jgi:PKD repeat protein